MKRLFTVLFLLFMGLTSAAQTHYPEKYNHDKTPGQYPQEMIIAFGKNYLDRYFSLPESERNDLQINQWGEYPIDFNGPALNSKYRPETIIYPFRPKSHQAIADYYFEEGLKMPKPKSN